MRSIPPVFDGRWLRIKPLLLKGPILQRPVMDGLSYSCKTAYVSSNLIRTSASRENSRFDEGSDGFATADLPLTIGPMLISRPMAPSPIQALADTMVLGALLDSLREQFGRYELVDHWKQGEFHHDVIVRVPQAGDLPGGILAVATNCNGGVKEVMCFTDIPSRSALWHWRCPDMEEFTGSLPPILERAVTHHWFDPCALLGSNARSELKEEFRQRQEGGGWEPVTSVIEHSSQHESVVEPHVNATIEMIEDGFFHPSTQFAGENTDAHHFHYVGVAGIPVSVQFVRARVTIPSENPSEHLLIGAAHPALEPETIAEIQRCVAPLYPSASLSFYVQHEVGQAKLVHDGTQSAMSIAAASAAWMCCASWDESDPIVIVVNGRPIAASMEYSYGRWSAKLTRLPSDRAESACGSKRNASTSRY